MSNHYDLSLTKDGKAYQFITDNGDRYVAYFTEFILQNSNGEDIVLSSFGFTKETVSSLQKERFDPKVKATILFLIQEFFDKNPGEGVLYICLDNDDKGRNRHITFSKWFRELGGDYEKYDAPVSSRAFGLYSSLIVPKASPQKFELKEAFYYTIEYWMRQ